MKRKDALLLCLLLAGCDQPTNTQLTIDTGRQLQRAIDTSPARGACEDIAQGRERLSHHRITLLKEKGCQYVFRSSTETNLTDTAVYHSSMTMVCGGIIGKNFIGEDIQRRYLYSPNERALVIEPMSPNDKTRFEDRKTLAQLHADFERQRQQYCK